MKILASNLVYVILYLSDCPPAKIYTIYINLFGDIEESQVEDTLHVSYILYWSLYICIHWVLGK